MNLNTIINQLRLHCPSFGGRVAGSARFKRLPEDANLLVPAAYVIPLDDNPGDSLSLNDVRQMLVESFAVIVVISNVPDERGQAAVNSAHDTIRAEIWKALLGWQPDKVIYNGITYQGGNLLDLDRSRLWYQFDFGAEMQIGPEDGWQAIELDALPPFDGMNIKWDYIDPAADPNLQYPGPDGRIEHEFNIPKSGSLYDPFPPLPEPSDEIMLVTTILSSGASRALVFPASGSAGYDITLTANCTFTLSGGTAGELQTLTVFLRQGVGAGFLATLPAGIIWNGGIPPVPNTLAGRVDVYAFSTPDAGVTIFGSY